MPPILGPLLLILALAACVPQPGNQLAPVDYRGAPAPGDYGAYEAERLGRGDGWSGDPTAGASGAEDGRAISSDELRAAGLPAGDDATGTRGGLPPAEPVPTRSIDDAFEDATGNGEPEARREVPRPAAPGRTETRGISDEQSFAAVSARESIDSDAERLARQRAAYRVIEPRALPQREGPSGPNIVQYALTTSHPVGRPLYSRGGLFGTRDPARACARFTSPDLAQREFLSRGGPERDRLGVDPDGDGYACGWDPAPFRAAQG